MPDWKWKPQAWISRSAEELPSPYLPFIASGRTEARPSTTTSDLVRSNDTCAGNRETPLPKTLTQSPKSLVPDLPFSSVSSLSHLERLHCAIGQCEGNILGDNSSEQTVLVSPVGEIAIDESDIIVACVKVIARGFSILKYLR